MPTPPAKVRQADLQRALKAASKVSPDLDVLILPDGTIRITREKLAGEKPRLDVRKEVRL